MNGKARMIFPAALAAALIGLTGCTSSMSNASNPNNPITTQQTGKVNVMLSDASTEDWATIAVKVESIALNP